LNKLNFFGFFKNLLIIYIVNTKPVNSKILIPILANSVIKSLVQNKFHIVVSIPVLRRQVNNLKAALVAPPVSSL